MSQKEERVASEHCELMGQISQAPTYIHFILTVVIVQGNVALKANEHGSVTCSRASRSGVMPLPGGPVNFTKDR